MRTIDLTPFGFTATESLAYATLLRLGPTTGYAVAHGARLARANAYAALAGLVARGAAFRAAGRPVRFRPADPTTLVAQLAAHQGEALDRLSHSLEDVPLGAEPLTREVAGARAVANLILQLVARAERRVAGVLAAELWRPTLPGWRRAAARATLELRLAGEALDTGDLVLGVVPDDTPTLLVVDDAHLVSVAGAGDELTCVWSSHPLLVGVARAALRGLA
jgi:sugar-specific transcriptional regulator TrmB